MNCHRSHSEQVSEPGLNPGRPGGMVPRLLGHFFEVAKPSSASPLPPTPTLPYHVRLEGGFKLSELAMTFSYRPKTMCRAQLGPPEKSK